MLANYSVTYSAIDTHGINYFHTKIVHLAFLHCAGPEIDHVTHAPGLLSTLCTVFYALFGMLLRGGKTVEKREFLQDSKFRLLFTVILYVLEFCNFHLSISFCCRCRSEIGVCGLLPGFSSHWTVCDFHECFEKSLYGRNLLLTIQNLFLLLPRDIRFSTNEGVYPPVYSEYTEDS